MAGHAETPWWAKAAALHAAEMFDHQAETRERLLHDDTDAYGETGAGRLT